MRVNILLDDHDGEEEEQEVFTSMDYVRGSILLDLQRADAVSKITLTLQGKLMSSVIAGATNPLDGTLHAVDNHKLFKLSQTIFPRQDVPIPAKGFSLSKGATKLPFQFRFPVLSACKKPEAWIRHLKTTLPPTFKYSSLKKDGYAHVEYYLRVKVLRPGRFKSNIAVKRELRFLPLDPGFPPPSLRPTRGKANRVIRHEIPGSSNMSSSPRLPQVLDTCPVSLDVTLPSPAILRTRSTLPLSITASAQTGGEITSTPLLLRTLVLAIQIETTVNVGPNLNTWTNINELLNLNHLRLPLGREEGTTPFELSSDYWKDVIIPDITPSFSTCTLIQEHFFVVTAGFSIGLEGTIQTMKTSINIELHSGIERQPATVQNMTPEEDSGEDQMAFVPWRYGSERHLGILGRASSRPIDTPPPPY